MNQIRKLEAASLAASSFLVVATYLMVSTSSATGANPIIAALIGDVPWFVLASAKLLSVAGAFVVFRYIQNVDGQKWAKPPDWVALAGARSLTLLLFLNVVNDAVALFNNFPETYRAGKVAGFIAITLGAAVILYTRPRPSLRDHSRQRRVAAAISLSAMLIFSGVGGTLALSPSDPVQKSLTEVSTVDGDTVITGAGNQSVISYDATTGEINWVYSAPTDSVRSSPTVKNGTVYIGSNDQTLYAIDASSGTEEWTYSASGRIRSSPTVKNGKVYVGTMADNLIAVDADTGSEEWTYSAGSGGIYSSPIVVNGTAYVASTSNDLHAVDAETGNGDWTFNLGVYSDTSPIVEDGTVYVGDSDGNFYAIDASSGSEEWSVSKGAGTRSSPNIEDGTIYVGDSDGKVYALDASNGDTVWSFQTAQQIRSSPTVVDGSVYIGSDDGGVYSLDAETGEKNWNYSSGGSLFSSPTVKDGTVYIGSKKMLALDASDGSEIWSADVGGGTRSSPTFISAGGSDSSGSRVLQQTLGHHDGSWSSASGRTSVSGVVRDQNGNPVPNATVRVIGVDHSQISLQNADTLENRADDLLEQARNAKPPSWDQDLALTGSGGLFDDVSSEYPAVHSRSDWGLSGWAEGANLGEPMTQVPANEEVIVSAWDPTAGVTIQDGVDSDLPGVTTESNIQITHLDSEGDSLKTETVPLTGTYTGGTQYVRITEHKYGTVELAPGFYEISVEGSEVSYTIVAGDPDELAAEISRDLRNRAESLSEQAQEMRDRFESGKFTSTTVTTNESGGFSVDLGTNVKTVSVTAYKVPRGMDPQNATRADIREFYNTMLFEPAQTTSGFDVSRIDGFTRADANLTSEANLSQVVPAFYLPDGSVEVDVPASGVEVEVYETQVPRYANTSVALNRSAWMDNLLENLSFSELRAALMQRLNQTNATLQTLRDELHNLTAANERLRERMEKILAQQRGETVERTREFIRSPDKSQEELRQEIQALQQAIVELGDTVSIDEPEVDRGADAVSLSWGLPSALSGANVSVIAHYANGTSRVVPDEYVAVDEAATPLGGDTVRIEEFPLGEHDPASVQFELQAANAEEFASSEAVVKNPTAEGALPELDSVSVSSVTPGPSENVTVEVSPAESSSWKQITGVTVYGPGGEELGTSPVSDGSSFSFTTAGEGVHHIEITASTTNDDSVTIPVRIKALSTQIDAPPTLSVKSSPVGEYVLTSGDFDRASVDTQNARESVTVTAQIGEEADTPTQIAVRLGELSIPSSSTVSVQLVRGESQAAVSTHVPVKIHMSATTGDALYWRNGQAFQKSGSSQGAVTSKSDKTVVDTYTDGGGAVSIRRENSPSLLTSASHWIDRQLQGVTGLFGAITWQPPTPDVPAVEALAVTSPTAATADVVESPGVAGGLLEVMAR